MQPYGRKEERPWKAWKSSGKPEEVLSKALSPALPASFCAGRSAYEHSLCTSPSARFAKPKATSVGGFFPVRRDTSVPKKNTAISAWNKGRTEGEMSRMSSKATKDPSTK
ncbi:hypothetical protein A3H10_03830 [Candidatus Uhrbacteria bacterium RIFCSPLOWO2_12_FULL_46_10]|uniref:Uncharacterized protein n=1 Tax=Candidatus Uhrbacteria bacterium RIFCSPLOWO2_01_FULL_47_25 TaxID=1802402 RepID=A0A1F7URU4_9BACT|nr:MAG: hypothetical protein A2752_02200 [Candidatus Uhrbacteria bacterium RIFCSPHIGHO2_01_FULL_46_23]OGL68145.1 MAG: hypothetical protein A3D60_04035 [Candidatus Uhrbacteria bacterium RIFCSPHIGHO2_02_FULL_47_29]OGL74811.1 MAG: hypothetical protein A3E96_04650 [Candidatus Uhrbacteria bacterium RIFCSPHIGHO2_12_FULL_46_13]OGL80996.1 MAG: hypothetical protein A2936_03370 [Candidatus Uhrbacteria bacterium RIFCSPLOWO2_01_FULL_47_25]OGL84684.1 MAG: hypothetical protein A3I37_04945 [Candidatus Uhrbact